MIRSPRNRIRARGRPGGWLPAVACGLWLLASGARAQQDFDLSSSWSAVASDDDPAIQGQIVRPIICPADDNWLAFEVRDETQVRVFIYNALDRLPPREVNLPVPETNYTWLPTRAPQVRDFSWCPVRQPGSHKIWAVFTASVAGMADLYLYNVARDTAFRLANPLDITGTGRESAPAWSPDGHALAYTTNFQGNADVYAITNMGEVIAHPDEPDRAEHVPMLASGAHEFRASWCPIEGSGLMAYNYYDPADGHSSVRIYDILKRGSYNVRALLGEDRSLISPAWSPSGTALACYAYETDAYDFGRGDGPRSGDDVRLSVIGLRSQAGVEDGLELVSLTPAGSSNQADIPRIFWSGDDARGPAWLSDGLQVIVALFDEQRRNPLAVIRFESLESEAALATEIIRRPFKLERFSFPTDLEVCNNRIAFTFRVAQTRQLLFGDLVTVSEPLVAADSLQIAVDRAAAWKQFCQTDRRRR